MKTLETIDDLQLDERRVNAGTERGAALLKESMDQCGAGRSIVVDKNGVVLSGNKTLEAARAAGMAVAIVTTDGQELVVVQRTDLSLLDDQKARQLAYYDNRVHEVNLAWSPRQLQEDALAGVDLSVGFFGEELEKIMDLQPAPTETPAPVVPLPPPGAPMVVEGAVLDALPVAEKPEKVAKAPAIAYELLFDSVQQQVQWTGYLRQLKDRYPDAQTGAERLSRALESIGIGVPG